MASGISMTFAQQTGTASLAATLVCPAPPQWAGDAAAAAWKAADAIAGVPTEANMTLAAPILPGIASDMPVQMSSIGIANAIGCSGFLPPWRTATAGAEPTSNVEAERVAAWKAADERAVAKRAAEEEAERLASEKAAAEKAAKEAAERFMAAAEKAAAERAAKDEAKRSA